MKRFLPYFKLLKPVQGAFIGAIVCGLIFGLASGFGLPFVAQKVFPVLFSHDKTPETWVVIGSLMILPLAFAVRGISGFANTYLVNYCGTYILNQLRAKVFGKLQALPTAYFDKHSTGDILTRASHDTAVLQQTLLGISNDLVKYPVTLVGAIAATIYLALQQHQLLMILMVMAIVPLCIIPIRILGRLLQKRALQMQGQTAAVTDILNENIRGVREVRLYGQEAYQAKRFDDGIATLRSYIMKIVKYQAALSPMIEFISATGVTVAIYFAFKAHLTLDSVLPLIMALYMCYEPIKKLGAVHNSIRQGGASLERIEALLNEPTVIDDAANPVPMARAKGEIEFKDVTLRYGNRTNNALEGLNLKIPAGMVVGIVGPSGAGKSTLLNILPRLYSIDGGVVTIDGVDTKELTLADLRRQIAVVPQEAFLFSETMAMNIAMGDANATMEKIVAAAKEAQAHDFIMSLPKGYETKAGEAGRLVSGGQRQRLAIARAFYKNAPILLLDEPTSALDAENENEIFASLKDLAQGRTSLIVSHRLKSLYFCHKIAYLEAGKLVAFDTHEKLYATVPAYKKLYDANEHGEA